MARASDQMLVRRAIEGDADAAGELFQRHWKRAWKAAYRVLGDRELAEDALQEGFIRVINSLPSFRTDGDFGAWAATITANRARTIVETRAQRPTVPLDERMPAGDSVERSLDESAVVDAIRDLPEDQGRTVMLREVGGYSTAETAEITGVSE
ncbi:MAG: sigma-70 family RNA polymerase sigma factor, partial [Miltoncostaeaceae bacterium]